MPTHPRVVAPSVRVDILWGPDVLAGAALAVVDILRTLNLLASMRAPRAAAPVAWRWWCLGGARAPQALPQSARFRGNATMLVVPGWHAQSGPHLNQLVRQAASEVSRVAQVHAAGGLVAGLYNGAALLGEAGLLQHRSAVLPWPFATSVLRHAQNVTLLTDRSWVGDQRIWTCDSPALATEVVLDMLRQTCVHELAVAATHVVLHSTERQQVAARIVQGEQQRVTPTGALERARRWLEAHLSDPYSLADTARAAATSQRTLLRHFAAVYGQSPLDYLHSLRVSHARVLLETTYVTVEQVARMCGYQDVGTFRRVFLRVTGQAPATYRDRNRLRTSRKRWIGPPGAG